MLFLWILLGLSLPGCEGDATKSQRLWQDQRHESTPRQIPYPLDSMQIEVVNILLGDTACLGWRIAVASDNSNHALESYQRETRDYEPYLVQGDFDGDGRTDFALALVRDTMFAVYWFRACPEGQYYPAERIAELTWLNECGMFFNGQDLVIGPFYSDDLMVFSWNVENKQLELQKTEDEP